MQFLTSLFGAENPILTSVVALGIVLVLIVLGLWVLKLFFRASNTLVRGRGRRMMVLETVAIDTRRQLILIRRDDVEHLILTGGPQDLVVESGIPVDRAALPRRPAAPTASIPAPEAHGPSRPVSDALEAAQALAIGAPAPASPMDRLRELARPVTRAPRSLRHTGLMRPVSRMEPAAVIPMNPEGADTRRTDSAKTGAANDSNGQAGLGAGKYPGNGITAEGS